METCQACLGNTLDNGDNTRLPRWAPEDHQIRLWSLNVCGNNQLTKLKGVSGQKKDDLKTAIAFKKMWGKKETEAKILKGSRHL